MAFPTAITNRTFRLVAEDLVGLGDNQPLTGFWNDASANGEYAFQSTASSQPTVQTAELNGKAVVRFVTDDYLEASPNHGSTLFTTAATAFVVLKGWTAGSPLTGGGWLQRDLGATHFPDSGLFSFSATAAPANVVLTLAFDYGNGVHTAYNNGTQAGTLTRAASTPVSGGLRIGGYAAGNIDNLSGDIAEVIVFSRILTTNERAQVHTYAQDTYGISVSDYAGPPAAVAGDLTITRS